MIQPSDGGGIPETGAQNEKSAFLLTGAPGVGKTTVIKQVAARLDVPACGFYTEEIRDGRRRRGFRLVTLDGQEAILAHDSLPSTERVGRYAVDVPTFEAVGVAALRRHLAASRLLVIDEIGKMELFSQAFAALLWELLPMPVPIIGTIMAARHPVADAVNRHPRVEVLRLTTENRAGMVDELALRVTATLRQPNVEQSSR